MVSKIIGNIKNFLFFRPSEISNIIENFSFKTKIFLCTISLLVLSSFNIFIGLGIFIYLFAVVILWSKLENDKIPNRVIITREILEAFDLVLYAAVWFFLIFLFLTFTWTYLFDFYKEYIYTFCVFLVKSLKMNEYSILILFPFIKSLPIYIVLILLLKKFLKTLVNLNHFKTWSEVFLLHEFFCCFLISCPTFRITNPLRSEIYSVI